MTLVIFAGYAGSGKSTFATMLEEHLRWPIVDKDTLSQPFVDALNAVLTGDKHDRTSYTYQK